MDKKAELSMPALSNLIGNFLEKENSSLPKWNLRSISEAWSQGQYV